MKTIAYIDGYNLYYGCLRHGPYKWLDLYKLLAEHIIRAQNPLSKVTSLNFYTADIKAKIASKGQQAMSSQLSYHRALTQLYDEQIQIKKGYYSLERAKLPIYQTPPDKKHRIDVWKLEEKQTDVNLALDAYRDVSKGCVEQIVFVTNDTDIEPALAAIREDFKDNIQIGVIIPVRKDSGRPANRRLSNYANWTRKYITDDELASSQLPERIATRKKPITKPEYW